MPSNLFLSLMRTLVPAGVALVLSLTGRLGIQVDSADAAVAVAFGLYAAYVAVFRGLEWLAQRMAWRPLQIAAGLFLGWARPPVYEKEAVVPLRFTVDKEHLDREARAAVDVWKRVSGGGSQP